MTSVAVLVMTGDKPELAVVPVNLPPFMSARTVSRVLALRKSKVYQHCRAGTWPGTRREGSGWWRIRTSALVAWYAEQLGIPEEHARVDIATYLPRAHRPNS